MTSGALQEPHFSELLSSHQHLQDNTTTLRQLPSFLELSKARLACQSPRRNRQVIPPKLFYSFPNPLITSIHQLLSIAALTLKKYICICIYTYILHFIYFMFMCVCTCHYKGQLVQSQFSSSTMRVLGIELKSSGLAASALTPELSRWPYALSLAGSYLWTPVTQPYDSRLVFTCLSFVFLSYLKKKKIWPD